MFELKLARLILKISIFNHKTAQEYKLLSGYFDACRKNISFLDDRTFFSHCGGRGKDELVQSPIIDRAFRRPKHVLHTIKAEACAVQYRDCSAIWIWIRSDGHVGACKNYVALKLYVKIASREQAR